MKHLVDMFFPFACVAVRDVCCLVTWDANSNNDDNVQLYWEKKKLVVIKNIVLLSSDNSIYLICESVLNGFEYIFCIIKKK